MKIQLIRHATVLLEINGKTILIDPMFSHKGTLSPIKDVINQNNNPLVDLPLPIENLLDCDSVLLTHTHRDHFDEAAIKVIPKEMPIFCQPKDEAKLKDLGFLNVTPVNRNILWENINIARTPAKHGHGVTALSMAPVSGYVISTPGEPTVYVTGDSIFYSGTKKILEKYSPDIALCNCGEAAFASEKPITMGTPDLSEICRLAPRIKIVAIHMEAWNHCGLSRAALKKYVFENKFEARIFVPDNGEIISNI